MMMTIKKWNNLESSRVFTDWRKKWSGFILMQNIAVFHEYVWNHIYVDQNNSFAVQNWDLSRACVRCCYKKIPSAKCFLHIVWWLVSNKSEIHRVFVSNVSLLFEIFYDAWNHYFYSVKHSVCMSELSSHFVQNVLRYRSYVEGPFTYLTLFITNTHLSDAIKIFYI